LGTSLQSIADIGAQGPPSQENVPSTHWSPFTVSQVPRAA
jgi:hypothetical protein